MADTLIYGVILKDGTEFKEYITTEGYRFEAWKGEKKNWSVEYSQAYFEGWLHKFHEVILAAGKSGVPLTAVIMGGMVYLNNEHALELYKLNKSYVWGTESASKP